MNKETQNNELALRKKRALYRCWHRGTQEMDIILGHFANAKLDEFSESELDRFEKLINEQDTDLLKWVLGQEEPPNNIDKDLIEQLRNFQLAKSAVLNEQNE